MSRIFSGRTNLVDFVSSNKSIIFFVDFEKNLHTIHF